MLWDATVLPILAGMKIPHAPISELADASEPAESPSARAARLRRDDAERKRQERRKRKALGVVDPQLLDRVIVDALRSGMLVTNQGCKPNGELPVGQQIPFDWVLRTAAADLQRRGYKGQRIGEAIIARLATA